jgi:glyoxylate/hydroxypyruvate reductase A
MLLIHLNGPDEARWQAQMQAALPGRRVVRRGDDFDPRDVRYMLVWKPTPEAFDGLTGLVALLSLGAGVDALLAHPRLPDVPMVRFVDADLSQRMSDYVVAQVTMHHRLFTRFAADQAARRWTQVYPGPAHETVVGVMGLGVLGQDAARRLLALGFSVHGWSRSPKAIEGVTGFAGPEQFGAFLAGTDILVNLLPLTEQTRSILNLGTFRRLRRDGINGGPAIVNAARGGHQVEADIVTALTDGTLAAASLDVFEVEPLPADSPLWGLGNCFITPHIAAISHPESGVRYFSGVIRDHEAGLPLPNIVERARGY